MVGCPCLINRAWRHLRWSGGNKLTRILVIEPATGHGLTVAAAWCMSAGGLVSSRARFFWGSDRPLFVSPWSTITHPSESVPLLVWPSESLCASTSSCARFFFGDDTFLSPLLSRDRLSGGASSGVSFLRAEIEAGRLYSLPDRSLISSSWSCSFCLSVLE